MNALSMPSGKTFHLTHTGLKIVGHLDLDEWRNLLESFHAVKHAYHCALADLISYGRNEFGDDEVAATLEQMEFELADVTKAEAIGQLTFDFREENPLTSEHYFVLSKLEKADCQKWAKIAVQNKLSALELKRSIEAGMVLRLEDIQNRSGQGSGINTIQGVVFRLTQWEKSMGGTDRIIQLPSKDRRDLLDLLTPAIELAAKIEASLTND